MQPRLSLPAIRLALVLAPLAAGALHAQSTVLYASDFEADDGGFVSFMGEWEHGAHTAGSGGLGAGVELAVDDPGASFPAGSLGYVAIALGPDPLLPAGTPIPGLGMAAPGATGDLLVDLGTLVAVAGGAAWAPGAPAKVALAVPASPTLAGVAVWFQGALVDAAPSGLRIGFTTGLYEVLGP